MKKSLVILLFLFALVLAFSSCSKAKTIMYTVNFNTDGGSQVASQNIKENEFAVEPDNPIKTDYDFGGWYTSQSYSEKFLFTNSINKDITLYALWNKKQITLTYDMDGGIALESQTINKGEKYVKPLDPTKEGCIFDGWYLDESKTSEFDFDQYENESLKIYAKWLDAVEITFNPNNGDEVIQKIIVKNTKVELPTNPLKNGFYFEGWFDGVDLFNSDNVINQDIILKAKWTQLVTVSFEGIERESEKVKIDSVYNEPVVDIPDGKILYGWFDDKNLSELHNFEENINVDIVIYANIKNLYNVEFKWMDGNGTIASKTQKVVAGNYAKYVRLDKDAGIVYASQGNNWYTSTKINPYFAAPEDIATISLYDFNKPVESDLILYTFIESRSFWNFPNDGNYDETNKFGIETAGAIPEAQLTYDDISLNYKTNETITHINQLQFNQMSYPAAAMGRYITLAYKNKSTTANTIRVFVYGNQNGGALENIFAANFENVLRTEMRDDDSWASCNLDLNLSVSHPLYNIVIIRFEFVDGASAAFSSSNIDLSIKDISFNNVKKNVVTFTDQGVENILKINNGESISAPLPKYKKGYVFEGWKNGEGTLFDFESIINDDLTLKASYSKLLTVKFMKEENLYSIQKVKSGEKAKFVRFDDNEIIWATSANYWYNGTELYDFNNIITEDIILNSKIDSRLYWNLPEDANYQNDNTFKIESNGQTNQSEIIYNTIEGYLEYKVDVENNPGHVNQLELNQMALAVSEKTKYLDIDYKNLGNSKVARVFIYGDAGSGLTLLAGIGNPIESGMNKKSEWQKLSFDLSNLTTGNIVFVRFEFVNEQTDIYTCDPVDILINKIEFKS